MLHYTYIYHEHFQFHPKLYEGGEENIEEICETIDQLLQFLVLL